MPNAASVMRDVIMADAAAGQRGQVVLRFVRWQAWQRLARRPMTVTAFGNAKLRLHPHRTSSALAYYHGMPDPWEMAFVRDVLRPGDTFLDVGANVGVYSVLAGSIVAPDGLVVCLEPAADTAEILRENLQLNNIPARLIAAAAGAEPGTAAMTSGHDATNRITSAEASGQELAEIDVVTLDEVCESLQPVVAKVDVEGFELEAMRGSRRLLADRRPAAWLIEVNELSDRTDLVDLLDEATEPFIYEPHERALVPLSWSDAVGRRDIKNVLAVADRAFIASRLTPESSR
ncbi:FkbM family methyltransferase [Euzebya sp.]|uniref:FkbM family methyltransferase n=1 Tax=Euzebya sp. TaxID=1971409 RepID=UPI0035149855